MCESECQQLYTLLREELISATGCTEPVAVAYAAAKARELLVGKPIRAVARCSGNIIKNVKSVVVPNSGGMKGLEASVVIGMLSRRADKGLAILEEVGKEEIEEARVLLAQGFCTVEQLDTPHVLHFIVTLYSADHSASVEVAKDHQRIISMQVDGVETMVAPEPLPQGEATSDRPTLTISRIYTFIQQADPAVLEDILGPQISCNLAIAREGLAHDYGAQVGQTLLEQYGDSMLIRAKAMAAAGSDARMSGCSLPVVINSGSGNQGICASVPVIVCAEHFGTDREQLLRALALSNLTALHLKERIGKLSAYCGVVSAATGSGAAIAYLNGLDYDGICRTITNVLGNISGMVCDGAKPSCAAKIASAVDAAIMGYALAARGHTFQSGDGLVKSDIEQTIDTIGTLGKEGMQETDMVILNLMLC